MVGGEARQSGFHFLRKLVLLRTPSARGYGISALVMVLGGLGLTYVGALSAMPASLCIGHRRC